MRACDRFELRIGCEGYPDQLAQSPDPPAVIYGVGDPEALVPGLAVVGARRATPYGLTAARMMAGWAAAAGYVIVSGGAVGCDQTAHRAALDAGGLTVAVMGGGADVVYPRDSRSLLGEISAHGAVVSEHPWGAEPKRWTFRTRNRIIAWLSQALLVVEAALPSGTFSTADYMAEAGRDVLAVPGSIFSEESRGPNRLISQGATPVTDPSELSLVLAACIGPRTAVGEYEAACLRTNDEIVRALRASPMRLDDLARSLTTDVIEIARRVGELEVLGSVVRLKDGRYSSVPPLKRIPGPR